MELQSDVKVAQALKSLEVTNNWSKRDIGYGSIDDQCSDASMWIRLGFSKIWELTQETKRRRCFEKALIAT